MNRHKSAPNILAAVVVISGAIFLLDYLTPLGSTEWVLYLLPVAFCVLQNQASLPFSAALIETVLIVVGFFVSPAGMAESTAAINRSFGVFAMWCVALLVHQVIRERLKSRRLLWLQQGQAETAVSMVGEQNLAGVADNFLRSTALYLNAQMGLLYRLEHGRLHQSASYATVSVGAKEEQQASYGMAEEVAKSGRAVILRNVPHNYQRFGSLSGSAPPGTVLIAPITLEGKVAGVLELGFSEARVAWDDELDLLMSIAESAGIALRSALYRQHLRELLEETQQQSEELQAQQEELRASNEELEEQSRVLRESQEHLENQQIELEQTNVQLEEQARRVESQKQELLQAYHNVEQRGVELERASRYKSEFLANMSHELRTPLNSSLILSQILGENRSGGLTADEINYAKTIHASNSDLLSLINDILDLSKIEAGHANIEPQMVGLTMLIEALRARFDALAREKSLAFRIEVEAGTPQRLVTDHQRLQQILNNLLSNAFKFTEHGEVVLQIRHAGPGLLGFAVRDTGIGIGALQQQIIFDAFRQADGSTSRKYGGTGLGLSISRELARLLGGAIRVDSVEGSGSTFTLEIAEHLAAPAAASALPRATEAAPPAAADVLSMALPRREELVAAPVAFDDRHARHRERLILVIEDDATLCENIKLLLDANDIEIRTAGSIAEALRCVSDTTFDCIVMDLTLPDGSGHELLEHISNGGRYFFPPVIVYTGRVLSRAEEQSLQRYSKSIIIKGAKSPERLLDEVSLFLHRVEASLPQDQQRLLSQARQRDTVFEGRKILLAEDDVRNIFALSSIFEPLGAKLIIARNGREALDQLERNSEVDLVLMDLMMPEMDGLTALRLLRQRSEWAHLPVIALTAKAMADDRRNCLDAGANDYIAKPIDVDKLVSLCRVWMPK